MRWPGLIVASVLPCVAVSALGKLYHPEYLGPGHGPALIDCGGGFESALNQYFRDDAGRDGLPVSGTPALTLATPKAPISRFTARFAKETFTGFVYLDPTLTEGEGEPEEAEDDPKDRVCSASFVDSRATVEERRQLERGWAATVARLHLEGKVAHGAGP